MAEDEKIPKWQIFDQEIIDELEELYLEQSDELKETNTTAKDAFILGMISYVSTIGMMQKIYGDIDEYKEKIKKLVDKLKASDDLKEIINQILDDNESK